MSPTAKRVQVRQMARSEAASVDKRCSFVVAFGKNSSARVDRGLRPGPAEAQRHVMEDMRPVLLPATLEVLSGKIGGSHRSLGRLAARLRMT